MTKAQWQHMLFKAPQNLTLKQLAKHLGKSYKQTQRMAMVFGYARSSGHLALWTAQRKRQFRRVPWDRVPWQLTNVALARKYGVSREIARRRRKEYGKNRNRMAT